MRIWLGVGITVLIIIIVVPAGKILAHIVHLLIRFESLTSYQLLPRLVNERRLMYRLDDDDDESFVGHETGFRMHSAPMGIRNEFVARLDFKGVCFHVFCSAVASLVFGSVQEYLTACAVLPGQPSGAVVALCRTLLPTTLYL